MYFLYWLEQKDVTHSVEVEVCRDCLYHSATPQSLSLDLYLPDTDAPSPVLVYAHGGGFVEGDKNGDDSQILPEIAARGITCLDIQYRLAPAASFPAPIQDMKAAIRWARTHANRYGLNPGRIWTGGVSAGAYLATFCAATPNQSEYSPADGRNSISSDVAGAIGISGIYDLHRYYRNDGKGTRFTGIPSMRELQGGAPRSSDEPTVFEVVIGESFDHNPTRYATLSPASQATTDISPTLLCHGTADAMLPYDQARHYRDVLADLDVCVECFTADDGGHGFFHHPEWRSDVIDRISTFIHRS
jgi:acetyl esterase/lipase